MKNALCPKDKLLKIHKLKTTASRKIWIADKEKFKAATQKYRYRKLTKSYKITFTFHSLFNASVFASISANHV